MGKEEEITLAKRSYTTAKEEGNRQEEAKWANVIGHIHKNRGEYVKALKWLRYDYDVSVKYLPEKHLLPTCQSLGELHLRLQHFSDALFYQKKHLELAKDANDLIEQQRASTQLGRTYHEMLLKSDDDHYSVRNAKKYFRLAMKLAQSLKENQPTNRCSFLKEYIDAHNNIGMLEKDLDNFEEAKRLLTEGLEICDEEEVGEDDDSRSRLHHNLGSVYMELRLWDKAMEHIEKDITICQRIGHIQGEAKGYINLGELHYRVQKYVDAIRCYKKGFGLAKSLEDEDALVDQIDQNIETVEKAMQVMDEIKKEEQSLKKLTRKVVTMKGTPCERKCLLQQNGLLDRLIEKSSIIFAWWKHRKYAKKKKRIASQLFDKEKLSDSFLVLGESYQQLRNFKKAIKWFKKSWDIYKSIGNLEGQALAKINLGDALDSDGDWMGALQAFEEGYRIAIGANLQFIQLSALENMHYSNMMRFDNIEEARRLQLEINKLKQSKSKEPEVLKLPRDCCSETDTAEDDCLSDSRSTTPCAPDISKSPLSSRSIAACKDLNDNAPLISLVQSMAKQKTQAKHHYMNSNLSGLSPECIFQKTNSRQKVGRKRVRLVLSDDDGEMCEEVDCLRARIHENSHDNADDPILDEYRRENNPPSSCKFEDCSASKHASSSCSPINVKESANSYKSQNPKTTPGKDFRSSSNDLPSVFAACGPKYNIDVSENATFGDNASHLRLQNLDNGNRECLTFRIDNDLINVDPDSSLFDVNKLSMESLKVELACMYYLHLPTDKRSKGLLPIIQHIKCSGRVLESLEEFHTLKANHGRLPIEVSISGWLQKRLMRLYLDCCEESNEMPKMKLLKKLYMSEVEDEVSASDCELQDISITPLLNALHTHKSVALLDLSHNLLGNGTMEKLQQFFTSGQKYGDLMLDLHCNRFGPTALFQICECPVLFTRLEVLNISGNRLTDACGSYLSTILEKCKVLYSLNIERCSITSRTIQKVADALNADSVLAQLSIGYNNPISGTSIINLLAKLATLRSFTELNLTGVKLIKTVIDSLCQLVKISRMSCVMLGSTDIGTDAALQLMESFLGHSEESVKLDLSYCGIKSTYISKLNSDSTLIRGIIELNLGGNPIHQEGENGLESLLMDPQCCLKVLVLCKCQLGFTGILQVICALKENDHLEELYLADNNDLDKRDVLQCETRGNYDILHSKTSSSGNSKMFETNEVAINRQGIYAINTNCNQHEVADSEDDVLPPKTAPSEFDDSCTSSCQKNQSLDSRLLQELSAAVCMAKQLRLLDLSNNSFSTEVAEELYAAWTSRSASGLCCSHIKDEIIHFSMEANRCCRVKSCCQKE